MDKVTVVIPTYGGGETLVDTLQSVLIQDYEYFDIIIVDDNGLGSVNQKKTEDKIKNILKMPNVTYICHDKNKNGSAARNTGVKSSSAKYLVFLDDDDIMCQGTLKSQVDVLNNLDDSWGMVYCSSIEYFNNEVYAIHTSKKEGNLLYEALTHQINAATSTWMVKRTAYDKLNGFDESFKRHQDYEFITRMAFNYKIASNEYNGIHKYWDNLEIKQDAQEIRDFYLEKMSPIINTFSKKYQKRIILVNQMGIAIKLIKEKKYKNFYQRYKEINGGLEGGVIIFRIGLSMLRRKINLFLWKKSQPEFLKLEV